MQKSKRTGLKVTTSRKKEIKLEDETYCGKIPACQGTIAFGSTLYECQKELLFALEDWLINGLRHGDKIPIIEGINLNQKEATKTN